VLFFFSQFRPVRSPIAAVGTAAKTKKSVEKIEKRKFLLHFCHFAVCFLPVFLLNSVNFIAFFRCFWAFQKKFSTIGIFALNLFIYRALRSFFSENQENMKKKCRKSGKKRGDFCCFAAKKRKRGQKFWRQSRQKKRNFD